MTGERVLVTGGSGFVGVHCILALLDAGYKVRTTVRSLDRDHEVRAMLAKGGAPEDADVEYRVAELLSDAGWSDAMTGCTYVLHVASPFPGGSPKDENDLIRPAREGALRVLKAARDSGVKRVVLTSSFAAIGYGTEKLNRPYTEKDWTDPTAPVGAYTKSKTLAERAAWDFIENEGGDLELSVVNPVLVVGPALGPKLSTSVALVKRILTGGLPALPKISFGIVDVRDVADLHIRAMTNPAAKGERFLAVSDEVLSLPQIAGILRTRLGSTARKVPRLTIPNWILRAAGAVIPSVREISSRLDHNSDVSNAKAKVLLDWAPRSNEESLEATAMSLVDLGLVPSGPTA